MKREAKQNMALPLTRLDFLKCIAVETARMSYPGSMSRGKKPVVAEGTKALLEGYFRDAFPIAALWDKDPKLAFDYDDWHNDRVNEIAAHIGLKVSTHNVQASVAAKFLNTFMHQLMKYQEPRALFSCLHLPLDARVFSKLLRISSPSVTPHRATFERSPYSLPYQEHAAVQASLLRLVAELNARPGVGYQLTSRIDLNWLWL